MLFVLILVFLSRTSSLGTRRVGRGRYLVCCSVIEKADKSWHCAVVPIPRQTTMVTGHNVGPDFERDPILLDRANRNPSYHTPCTRVARYRAVITCALYVQLFTALEIVSNRIRPKFETVVSSLTFLPHHTYNRYLIRGRLTLQYCCSRRRGHRPITDRTSCCVARLVCIARSAAQLRSHGIQSYVTSDRVLSEDCDLSTDQIGEEIDDGQSQDATSSCTITTRRLMWLFREYFFLTSKRYNSLRCIHL